MTDSNGKLLSGSDVLLKVCTLCTARSCVHTAEVHHYWEPSVLSAPGNLQGLPWSGDRLDLSLGHLHTESVRSPRYQVTGEDKSCSRLINYVIRSCDVGDKTGLSESGISIFFITTSSLNQCVAGLKVPGELFRKWNEIWMLWRS